MLSWNLFKDMSNGWNNPFEDVINNSGGSGHGDSRGRN